MQIALVLIQKNLQVLYFAAGSLEVKIYTLENRYKTQGNIYITV